MGQVGEDRLQLQRTRVDLAVLVEEAVEATRPFAEKRGMAVEVEAPPQLSASVDAQRIRQVLDNPLSNAVQYNGAGGTVSVVLRHDEDAIELAVSDTGMGIVQDEVEHVFGRFFRGGAALEKHIPGTGLGLNIVNSIVAAHDGVDAGERGRPRQHPFGSPCPTGPPDLSALRSRRCSGHRRLRAETRTRTLY